MRRKPKGSGIRPGATILIVLVVFLVLEEKHREYT
jgi:hypothetical protein